MGQYVALLDILGFKDIIQNNPHHEVVELFQNFPTYVQMGLSKSKTTTDKFGRRVYDIRETIVNSTIISDSIIFWTHSNIEAFFELLNCLQTLTSFCHNLPKIFLRGGITYGDFFYHNNGVIKGNDETLTIHPIMVGKSLVEVYEIEKTLQIAGCTITESAIVEARKSDEKKFDEEWQKLISEQKILEYEMPTKTGTRSSWTINWVNDSVHPDLEEITNGFSSFNKKIDDPSVITKIKNTIAYYLYVKEHIYKK